jgi:hypothetical protein
MWLLASLQTFSRNVVRPCPRNHFQEWPRQELRKLRMMLLRWQIELDYATVSP